MSFSDTIFLFVLALVLFGPKKLPEMARKAGKLMAELRRASNEFRSQIETEIAHLETEKKPNLVEPSRAPAGAVASLSANPAANQSALAEPKESPVTFVGPTPPASQTPPGAPDSALPNPSAPASATSAPEPAPTAAADSASDPTPATTQESHV